MYNVAKQSDNLSLRLLLPSYGIWSENNRGTRCQSSIANWSSGTDDRNAVVAAATVCADVVDVDLRTVPSHRQSASEPTCWCHESDVEHLASSSL